MQLKQATKQVMRGIANLAKNENKETWELILFFEIKVKIKPLPSTSAVVLGSDRRASVVVLGSDYCRVAVVVHGTTGFVMSTSPCWTCTNRPHFQVTKSTRTRFSRLSRIQPIPLHGFGDTSLIRSRNEVILDALESCRRDTSFGSGSSSRSLVDHSVWPWKGAATPVLGFFHALYRVGP